MSSFYGKKTYSSECAELRIENESFFTSNSQSVATVSVSDGRQLHNLKVVWSSLVLVGVAPSEAEKIHEILKTSKFQNKIAKIYNFQ
jgi:hypothetical protein